VAWTATAFIVLLVGYVLKVSDLYSRTAVMTWFVLAPTTLGLWRLSVRSGLTKARTLGYNIRRVAIVGSGEHGVNVARTVEQAPWMGLKVVGMFDDRPPVPRRVQNNLPVPLLGKPRDLPDELSRVAIVTGSVQPPDNTL